MNASRMLSVLLLAVVPWTVTMAPAQPKKDKKADPVTVPVFSLSGPYTEMPIGDENWRAALACLRFDDPRRASRNSDPGA